MTTYSRHIALSLAEAAFLKPWSPTWWRDLGWKMVDFADKGEFSNPLSFFLRPIVTHSGLRLGLGAMLAVGVVIGAVASADTGEAYAMPTDTGGPQAVIVGNTEPTIKTTLAIRWPLEKINISQRFSAFHTGIDLRAPIGTSVYPVMAGRVKTVEYNGGGYGRLVVIDHGNGYESWYAHLSKFEVKEGQEVTNEIILGKVGSTGRSTGPHLHVEIRENGRIINPGPMLGI